ncbi:long-chain fatty acid transport protein [Pseudomonas sp. F-14 TE3623]
MIKPNLSTLGFISAIALSHSLVTFANNGVMLPAYGAKAAGMGGGAIALPQDAVVTANNPAGIALLDDQVDIDATLINAPMDMQIGSSEHKDTALVAIPGGGFTNRINQDFSWGVSIFSQGLDLDYDAPALGSSDMRNKLTQVVLAPTLTWQFKENHYMGLSPRIAYQRLDLAGLEGFGVTYEGADSAYGAGFSIGYLGKLTDKINIGASYSSPIWFQELDRYKKLLPGGDLNLPQQAGLGLSYQATDALSLAMDILWINWSGENAYGNSMNEGGALGDSNGPGFGWKDQYVYRLGANYKIHPKWTVRTGISLASELIGSEDVLFNTLAPLNQYDHYSLGATYQLNTQWEITGSYMHALSNDTSGTQGSSGVKIGGSIDYFNVGASYKY